MIALAVVPVVLATLLIGARGVAAMRTTSDFLVASRRITPAFNAAAVSGEYLSAASFLGIAGLVVKGGVGALWYPVGFAAGYVAMLTLVAAPMRRTGALTVPDTGGWQNWRTETTVRRPSSSPGYARAAAGCGRSASRRGPIELPGWGRLAPQAGSLDRRPVWGSVGRG